VFVYALSNDKEKCLPKASYVSSVWNEKDGFDVVCTVRIISDSCN